MLPFLVPENILKNIWITTTLLNSPVSQSAIRCRLITGAPKVVSLRLLWIGVGSCPNDPDADARMQPTSGRVGSQSQRSGPLADVQGNELRYPAGKKRAPEAEFQTRYLFPFKNILRTLA